MAQTSRSLVRRALFISALLFPLAGAASAAPRWQLASPDGGRITTMASSADGSVLYAAAETQVVRSQDHGATWQTRATPSLAPFGVYQLAVDPRDADVVWAAGYGAEVLVSSDGGGTWRAAGSLRGGVYQLVFDADDPDRIYAATGTGLFACACGTGSTAWRPLAFTDGDGHLVSSIAIDPRDADVLFATVWESASDAGGVWKSLDRGETWTRTPDVPGAYSARRLVFDPARPGTLYLLSDTFPYRTSDGGASWQVVTRQFQNLSSLLPTPTGRLFAAGVGIFGNGIPFGVIRSEDGGATWTPNATIVEPKGAAPYDLVSDLLLLPGGDDRLLAAGEQGLWRSRPGGRTWTASSAGLHALYADALAVHPADGTLFAGFRYGALLTRDGGITWRRAAPTAVPQPRSTPLVGDPSRADLVYAPEARLRSLDAGRHWQSMVLPGVLGSGYPYNTEFAGFAADPSTPGRLYTLGHTGVHSDVASFFLRSDDFGETWSTVGFPLFGFPAYLEASAIGIDAHGAVYVAVRGQGGGLYRSDDGGSTWHAVGAGLPTPGNGVRVTSSIVTDASRNGVVYVVVDSTVYRSGDHGAHFRRVAPGLPATSDDRTLAVEPGTGRLFVGVANHGVFAFVPGAASWAPFDAGLPPLDGRYGERFRGRIALDALNRRLYAATASGVFRLRLGR